MAEGGGKRMALYGATKYNPQESAGQWIERQKHEMRACSQHLTVKGDGTDMYPGLPPYNGQRQDKTLNFYQVPKQHELPSSFDTIFNTEPGYNEKLHRDDRQHGVGLDIFKEECSRKIPVRSSSEYGRRINQQIDDTVRHHVRINHVVKDFYRSSGTGIGKSNN